MVFFNRLLERAVQFPVMEVIKSSLEMESLHSSKHLSFSVLDLPVSGRGYSNRGILQRNGKDFFQLHGSATQGNYRQL